MGVQAPKGALVRLNRDATHLTKAEQQVAQVCLDRPHDVLAMSVQQLAAEAGSSTATVVRMCQTLGFSGFSQFKMVLAVEVAPSTTRVMEDVAVEDSAEDIARKVFQAEAATLSDTLAVLDMNAFAAAVGALGDARRIRFFGVGTSAPVASDAAFQFQGYGADAVAMVDAIQMEISTLALGDGDVAVAVSHSGATRATVDALERAKAQGARAICITSYAHSPIVSVADVALVVAGRETTYRSAANAGRLAHLAVIDALNIGVANRQPALRAEMHQHAAAVVARHSV